MGKFVKRLMLDDMYALGRNEAWFSDMARKGLHLKKIGRIFGYFENGEPRETNYRIDIIKENPSQEQLDVYHDCGWDIVTNNRDFYIFSADAKTSTTELHTDPIEQGLSLSDLNKRLRNNLIMMSMAMMLFLGMMFSAYFLNKEPFLFMIKGSFVQQMLLVVVELYVFYSVIRNYVAIRNLKKSLLQGNSINHREDFRKARLTGGILAAIFLPLAIVCICIPLVEISKRQDYTLTENNTNLPIVRLTEIEQNPKLRRERGYTSNNVDWANRVSYDWSLLAPVQYEIDEHGIIEGEVWGDNSEEYSPSITTRFFKLTFGNMAEKLTFDLISRYVYRDDTEIKAINHSELKMYLAEEGIRKHIFTYLDNKVMHVAYYGKRPIEDIIPMVEMKLLEY
ncbi:DUF2812 domain-containing protein [Desulfosporosinus sp.]|uniref:DUF2812 domain-containing protein n=1 Tax=Desulfosporosinus sp. TaxID=157907 RepID=UPI0025C53B83|nr:DUF2812 domain-containing protein [Desulfosporosinus sp.]